MLSSPKRYEDCLGKVLHRDFRHEPEVILGEQAHELRITYITFIYALYSLKRLEGT
jgi:hypothetical protein